MKTGILCGLVLWVVLGALNSNDKRDNYECKIICPVSSTMYITYKPLSLHLLTAHIILTWNLKEISTETAFLADTCKLATNAPIHKSVLPVSCWEKTLRGTINVGERNFVSSGSSCVEHVKQSHCFYRLFTANPKPPAAQSVVWL